MTTHVSAMKRPRYPAVDVSEPNTGSAQGDALQRNRRRVHPYPLVKWVGGELWPIERITGHYIEKKTPYPLWFLCRFAFYDADGDHWIKGDDVNLQLLRDYIRDENISSKRVLGKYSDMGGEMIQEDDDEDYEEGDD